MKIRKNIHYIHQKNVLKKCMLIYYLIGEQGKRHYVLIKDFNTFMYNHTLHRGRKHVCHCCLKAFSTKGILKCHVKDMLKIDLKLMVSKEVRCLKKTNMLD